MKTAIHTATHLPVARHSALQLQSRVVWGGPPEGVLLAWETAPIATVAVITTGGVRLSMTTTTPVQHPRVLHPPSHVTPLMALPLRPVVDGIAMALLGVVRRWEGVTRTALDLGVVWGSVQGLRVLLPPVLP